MLSIVMLVAVVTAVLRGHAEWARIAPSVWGHLLAISIALVLTPTMLLRPRGDRLHRRLGWIWATAMLLAALISFNIRAAANGNFSIIHLLSVWVTIQVPVILWSARTHRLRIHRRAVRGMVTGALLIAGFFTFPFNRLLGHWLLA